MEPQTLDDEGCEEHDEGKLAVCMRDGVCVCVCEGRCVCVCVCVCV